MRLCEFLRSLREAESALPPRGGEHFYLHARRRYGPFGSASSGATIPAVRIKVLPARVYLSIYLFVYVSIYLSLALSPSISRSLSTIVFLPGGRSLTPLTRLGSGYCYR